MFRFIDALLENQQLRSRQSRLHELDDRLLADIGLTRADLSTTRLPKRTR